MSVWLNFVVQFCPLRYSIKNGIFFYLNWQPICVYIWQFKKKIWQLMWSSLTIVSDMFDSVHVCLTIKFCVIQFVCHKYVQLTCRWVQLTMSRQLHTHYTHIKFYFVGHCAATKVFIGKLFLVHVCLIKFCCPILSTVIFH